jgi:predicted nucleic acid-binding protein
MRVPWKRWSRSSARDASVLFDTDVFIWAQRGNVKAATLIEREPIRFLSVQTYLELLQDARNKAEQRTTKQFLADLHFTLLPLTETIGHRAMVYIEEYGLASGLRAGDALIAATATENNLTLMSGNGKHFKPIHGLRLRIFTP